MDEMENNGLQNNETYKKKDRNFLKGVLFGIMLTVCVALCARSGMIIYRHTAKGEINYNTKAKLIYETLEKNYVGDIDKKDLYEGIYAGMVFTTTDRYSTYIPAEAYGDYKQSTLGEYVGIGVVVGVDEQENVVIKYVYENSGAEEAGVMAGDIITEAEGVSASYENYSDIVDIIKGVEGTTVKLKLYRTSQAMSLEKEVERRKVDTPTVSSAMLEDKIGYIRISQFEGVTYEQFKTAFDALNEQGMERLIVDVRNNPGGLLTSVSDILDEFLDEGVITYTEDKNKKREYVYSKAGGIEIPMVVLVNGSSASAAELFSAAVRDRGVATLVGENTYGKGVVQTTFPLTDGSAVKITTSKYYTPAGVCIDGVGVKPDCEIAANPDFQMTYLAKSKAEFAENDIQLEKAIEEVKAK